MAFRNKIREIVSIPPSAKPVEGKKDPTSSWKPLSESIAGYVALTVESLLIDDVYDIRSGVSYSFNPSFAAKTTYKTQSILVVPLMTNEQAILGVLQLITAKSRSGLVIPITLRPEVTDARRQASSRP